ncbi:MAG: biopolymer transporter ExbD [Methylophaga sp.]|nr:MAG: biopolymer transporter ExbD [Methylophaga sp.]
MSMNSYDSSGGMVSEINITPMVDVMLVLLIVFIVTAPLMMNAVSVKLPKAMAEIADSKFEAAKISVTAEGDIYLDKVQISQAELEQELIQASTIPDYSVEIFADEEAVYGTVAKVMATIQRAGIARFTFVLLPDTNTPSPS